MRARYVSLLAASGIAIFIAAASAVPLAGQGSAAAAKAAKSSVGRTPDGHPDLQGMYNIAWLTPLERPAGAEPTLSDQEAAQLERRGANRIETVARPSRGDREAPAVGGDGARGAAGNVGGYNNLWNDSGRKDRRSTRL